MTHNTLDIGQIAPPAVFNPHNQTDELRDVTAERDQLRRQVRYYQDALQAIASGERHRMKDREINAKEYAAHVLTSPIGGA